MLKADPDVTRKVTYEVKVLKEATGTEAGVGRIAMAPMVR